MKKLNTILLGLLIIQALLIAVVTVASFNQHRDLTPESLLSFVPAQVDRIIVNTSDENAEISKNAQGWQLADGLPADSTKIEAALTRLSEIKTDWPVATSANSHKRFELDKDNYRRRVQVYGDGKLLSELLIGSSPGFREAHVRSADNNDVFSLAVNTYDFPVRQDEWLDKALLAIENIEKITGADYTIEKVADKWVFMDSGDQQIDGAKAEALAKAFSDIRVQGIADIKSFDDAAISVSLSALADGRQYSYQLAEIDNQYYVQRSDRDTIFNLAKFHYDKFAADRREALVKSPEQDEANSAGQSPDNPPMPGLLPFE